MTNKPISSSQLAPEPRKLQFLSIFIYFVYHDLALLDWIKAYVRCVVLIAC
jgi:hypothetical protein